MRGPWLPRLSQRSIQQSRPLDLKANGVTLSTPLCRSRFPLWAPQTLTDTAPSTLYAAKGRLYPLERKLTHGLDLHGILDLCQHPRTDEDLSWLRLIAQSRGDVRHRPDSGIVESPS